MAEEELKKPAETIKDHINEVIQHVHGSSLSKHELEKELTEKLPNVTRKSINQFLRDYCKRAPDVEDGPGLDENDPNKRRQSNSKKRSQSRQRQMVNVDKVVDDELVQRADGETQADLKLRLSQKHDDILSARRQQEVLKDASCGGNPSTIVAESSMAVQGTDSKEETQENRPVENIGETVIEEKKELGAILIQPDREIYAESQFFETIELNEESKQSVIPYSQPIQNRVQDASHIPEPRQSQLRSSLRKPSLSKNQSKQRSGNSSKVRWSDSVKVRLPFQFVDSKRK